MARRARIAVVGSANIDLTIFADQFPKPGIRCILNPEPGQPVDMRALTDLDYFAPNESEAETITRIAVQNVDDAKRCAEKLVADGIRRIIITLGAKGSFLAGRGVNEHVPPFVMKSIDSTGAGDAFIGSFAVFLAEGVPEQEAVRPANLYAEIFDDRHRNAEVFLRSPAL